MNKVHSTNYFNTFIEVAEDCPALCGEIPISKGRHPTIAELQYEMLVKNPYRYTSDEILFRVFTIRNDISDSEYDEARAVFFSKGQPCFRASPLSKRYGFGIHSNSESKIAIYGRETDAYENFVNDPAIKKVKAMRTSRK